MSDRAKSASNVELIDGRFEIDLDAPVPALNSPRAEAYEARDRENSRASLYGLVVSPGTAWRGAAAHAALEIRHPALLQLHALGPYTVKGGKRAAVLVLERPPGPRLSVRSAPLDDQLVRTVVLPGLLDGLSGLHGHGVRHRAIRPSNLFWADERKESIILGECYSAPPGHDQASDYEPIERAGASLQGRGEGSDAVDLFAVGATLAELLSPPTTEKPDPTTRLLLRMERGSFEALASHVHCTGALRELLAGLLIDDAGRRWTIEEVRTWLLNPRANAPAVVRPRDGTRPYSVHGKGATQPRGIAHLFAQNVDAARQDLQKGQLVRWLRSSLGEHDIADEIEKHIGRADELARGRRTIDEDQVARVCCLLDPVGPVRFRGLSIMLDGFGPALAQAVLAEDEEAQKSITTMLTLGLPTLALRGPNAPAAQKALEAVHQSLRGHLRSKQPEAGIERCLYELESELPCLSPIVREQLPIGVHRFLAVLDRYASTVQVFAQRPLDRHALAYVSARLEADLLKKARAKSFAMRTGPSEAITDLAMLAMFQIQSDAKPTPNLARWLLERVVPSLEGLRNKGRRQRLIRALKQKAQEGDLAALLEALLDPREFRADEDEFRSAANRYHALGQQIDALARAHIKRAQIAGHFGRRIAAGLGTAVFVVACFVALLGSRL